MDKTWSPIRLAALWLAFAIVLTACVNQIPSPTAVEANPTVTLETPELPAPTAVEANPTMTPETPELPDQKRRADADVVYVRAIRQESGAWTFHVTVAHPDTGWEDYADGWDVVTPNGEVLKPDPNSPFTRLLLHPHETEQPFTRSQSNIVIPEDVNEVIVRAHDIVDGFGGQEVTVILDQLTGPNFETAP